MYRIDNFKESLIWLVYVLRRQRLLLLSDRVKILIEEIEGNYPTEWQMMIENTRVKRRKFRFEVPSHLGAVTAAAPITCMHDQGETKLR